MIVNLLFIFILLYYLYVETKESRKNNFLLDYTQT